jgi:hypothetical protein
MSYVWLFGEVSEKVAGHKPHLFPGAKRWEVGGVEREIK